MNENHVVVASCDSYDRAHVQSVVASGMAQLGVRPAGNVFVKPNVVFASNPDVFGTHATTHPGFVGACLSALSREHHVNRIDIGENCAIGFPTRYCYEKAGYYEEVARVRARTNRSVNLFCIDEDRRETVFVGGKVHDTLRLSRTMARADFKVYLPKLKCHCVSNMTGAVKLNIGICSDDERSIRHDFLLNEKIVDLLAVGWPDFIVMDAIEVGVGNEAFPTPRHLGLVLMGTNPLAVDLVGARLLGFELEDVPYLSAAVDRGYGPKSLSEVTIGGDLKSIDEIDEAASRVLPRDAAFTAWHDVGRELERLNSPMRFCWGPYRDRSHDRCLTGCVMGLKMFLASYEKHAGSAAFANAKPVAFVIGRWDETIDAGGQEVFFLGSCAKARVENASKIVRLDKCFCTASDMTLAIGHRLGIPAPLADLKMSLPLVAGMVRSWAHKAVGLRYAQDMADFAAKRLIRRL